MKMEIYESEEMLWQYLLFHYGTRKDILPYGFGPHDALGFPERCVKLLLQYAAFKPSSRAIDIGCGVGRGTFEFARYCAKVVGVDQSARFIAAAKKLQDLGSLEIKKKIEGDIVEALKVQVPQGIERKRVEFIKEDACHLSERIGRFDLALVSNLVDRVHDPRKCIQRLTTLMNPGGYVLICSPFSWDEKFAPKANWLGGYLGKDKKPVMGVGAISELMKAEFVLMKQHEIPFLISEHARKFQWCVAHGMIFKRKVSHEKG